MRKRYPRRSRETSTYLNRRELLCGIGSLPLVASGAGAQSAYPEKPIRLIVPYAAGTGTDALARKVAGAMQEFIGQPVVVENRPGGNAFIGTEAVARSAPDGYTLLMGTDHVMCFNPILFSKLPYNTADFTAVAGISTASHILVVNADLPVKTLADLVSLAKAKPGTLTVASTNVGTPSHLAGELFQEEAKIKLTHVPYQAAGQMFTDLLSGTVSMMFYPYQQLKAHIDSGRIRPLASGAPARTTWMPDLPTFAELGYPRTMMYAWFGIYAPAGTPADRISKLSEAIKQALAKPEFPATLKPTGMDVAYRSPADQAAFAASEMNRCKEVVQLSGVKLD
jgi:tripartite-type tricarboxylate transporter receptor subunit TctC